MASPRIDIARAFVRGQEAHNSTRSFRSVYESLHPHDPLNHDRPAEINAYPFNVTVLYTYQVALAVRWPNGQITLPTYDGHRWHHRIADTLRPNLYRKYSVTSSIHQHAAQVALAEAGVIE